MTTADKPKHMWREFLAWFLNPRDFIEKTNHVCPPHPFGVYTFGLGRGEHQPWCPMMKGRVEQTSMTDKPKHTPGEWRDIATAPKDGTRILATNENWVVITLWKDDGWRKQGYAFREPYWRYVDLTRWQPLPDPKADQVNKSVVWD